MAMTTITSKGQITIPVEYRRLPGYGPGDKVSVHQDVDGRLIIESPEDAINRTFGMLSHYATGKPFPTDDEIDEIVERAVVEDYLASLPEDQQRDQSNPDG